MQTSAIAQPTRLREIRETDFKELVERVRKLSKYTTRSSDNVYTIDISNNLDFAMAVQRFQAISGDVQ
jgi:hypothetical protein